MSEPLLYLPNSVKPSGGWQEKQKPRPTPRPRVVESPGRNYGQAAGSHISDLGEQEKAIWLCFKCKHRFDHKRAHYFYEKNLRVRGSCDACKTFDVEAHLFIHESTLTDPGGRSRHGQVWTPR